MLVSRPDPSQVILQAAANNLDGTPKTALTSADVRVYHVDGAGTEIEDLGSTAMAQVGSSSVWRYRWEPASLDVDQYFAEYTLVDTDGAVFVGLEDLVVEDFALQVDLEIVRQVETGRWKLGTDDVMTFYADDGVTPILEFDMKDINGLPSHINLFERIPK